MNGLTGALLSFLLLYKYVALFVLILASAVLPLPINIFLLAAGAFASQGYFSFSISLTVAIIANVLGDCFDYFLAKRYGHAILEKLKIKIPPFIDKIDRYVKKHAGITILITRFFGITSIITNFLSGFIDVPFFKFLFFDFIGNFLSIFGVLAAGYMLGLNWQNFYKDSNSFSYILSAIVIIMIIVIPLWHRQKQKKGRL